MKIFIIDTWNGEGYSDSNVFVEQSSDPRRDVFMLAANAVSHDPDIFTIETDKNRVYYSNSDDCGCYAYEEYDPSVIAFLIMPDTNSYEAIRDVDRLGEVIQQIRANSVDIEEGLQGCHHEAGEDGQAWILRFV